MATGWFMGETNLKFYWAWHWSRSHQSHALNWCRHEWCYHVDNLDDTKQGNLWRPNTRYPSSHPHSWKIWDWTEWYQPSDEDDQGCSIEVNATDYQNFVQCLTWLALIILDSGHKQLQINEEENTLPLTARDARYTTWKLGYSERSLC